MTIEQVRQCYDAQPFQPFVMHLADGREFAVTDLELQPPTNGARRRKR